MKISTIISCSLLFMTLNLQSQLDTVNLRDSRNLRLAEGLLEIGAKWRPFYNMTGCNLPGNKMTVTNGGNDGSVESGKTFFVEYSPYENYNSGNFSFARYTFVIKTKLEDVNQANSIKVDDYQLAIATQLDTLFFLDGTLIIEQVPLSLVPGTKNTFVGVRANGQGVVLIEMSFCTIII